MHFFRKRTGTIKRTTEVAAIRDAAGRTIGTRILIRGLKPDRNYPDLVNFTLAYADIPLPSSEEMDRFREVQDKLDALAEPLDFYSVGIMMIHGLRDWILYARDGQTLMGRLLRELGEYAPQMECQPDPRWSQYRDLINMRHG